MKPATRNPDLDNFRALQDEVRGRCLELDHANSAWWSLAARLSFYCSLIENNSCSDCGGIYIEVDALRSELLDIAASALAMVACLDGYGLPYAYTPLPDQFRALFERKNHDYGDSYKYYGPAGVVIRLRDKLLRIQQLTRLLEDAAVPEETLRDTLVDTHNYAIMAVMLIDQGR